MGRAKAKATSNHHRNHRESIPASKDHHHNPCAPRQHPSPSAHNHSLDSHPLLAIKNSPQHSVGDGIAQRYVTISHPLRSRFFRDNAPSALLHSALPFLFLLHSSQTALKRVNSPPSATCSFPHSLNPSQSPTCTPANMRLLRRRRRGHNQGCLGQEPAQDNGERGPQAHRRSAQSEQARRMEGSWRP